MTIADLIRDLAVVEHMFEEVTDWPIVIHTDWLKDRPISKIKLDTLNKNIILD